MSPHRGHYRSGTVEKMQFNFNMYTVQILFPFLGSIKKPIYGRINGLSKRSGNSKVFSPEFDRKRLLTGAL